MDKDEELVRLRKELFDIDNKLLPVYEAEDLLVLPYFSNRNGIPTTGDSPLPFLTQRGIL